MAGELEARAEKQRLRSGIPIPRRLWVTLDRLADRFEVARLTPLG
jgi:LDH2 family malate/lactate/ureidoglycolate dehydrogenase